MLCASAATLSQELSVDELKASIAQCAQRADDRERVACFDELAAALQLPPAPGQGSAGTEGTSAPSAPPPVPDDLGKPGDSNDSDVYSANVVKCEESAATRRMYFYFDNGQVWQQSNSGRLRIRDCVGVVYVERDAFGHKIRFEDESSTIRVRRMR